MVILGKIGWAQWSPAWVDNGANVSLKVAQVYSGESEGELKWSREIFSVIGIAQVSLYVKQNLNLKLKIE